MRWFFVLILFSQNVMAMDRGHLPKHPFNSHKQELMIWDMGLPIMWEDESIDYYRALETFRTA